MLVMVDVPFQSCGGAVSCSMPAPKAPYGLVLERVLPKDFGQLDSGSEDDFDVGLRRAPGRWAVSASGMAAPGAAEMCQQRQDARGDGAGALREPSEEEAIDEAPLRGRRRRRRRRTAASKAGASELETSEPQPCPDAAGGPPVLQPNQAWPVSFTTAMLRNIPNRYTAEELLAELLIGGFDSTFDFFYLPIDFKTKRNRGYAFINFLTGELASGFAEAFDKERLTRYSTQKILEVTPATTQGLEENLAQYCKKDSQRIKNVWFRPMVFHPEGEGDPAAAAASADEAAVEEASTGVGSDALDGSPADAELEPTDAGTEGSTGTGGDVLDGSLAEAEPAPTAATPKERRLPRRQRGRRGGGGSKCGAAETAPSAEPQAAAVLTAGPL